MKYVLLVRLIVIIYRIKSFYQIHHVDVNMFSVDLVRIKTPALDETKMARILEWKGSVLSRQ